MAYTITRACTRGELTECNCDDKVRNKDTKGKFEWGGCSENVHFGALFSKEFVDSKENANETEGLINLHNNEAGRRVCSRYNINSFLFFCVLVIKIQHGIGLQMSWCFWFMHNTSLLEEDETIQCNRRRFG